MRLCHTDVVYVKGFFMPKLDLNVGNESQTMSFLAKEQLSYHENEHDFT